MARLTSVAAALVVLLAAAGWAVAPAEAGGVRALLQEMAPSGAFL